MQIINSGGVYTFILGELEWYAAIDTERKSTIAACLEGAKAAKCQFATILVKPDAVMSISPNPRQHKVWGHTFPTSAETAFENALLDAYAASPLNGLQKAAIARKVFEL